MRRRIHAKSRLVAPLTTAIAVMAILTGSSAWAGARQQITLNAGEQYIIGNLDATSTPLVDIVHNPHALIVKIARAGQMILLGAEAGEWKIKATRADGEKIVYDVSVNAVARPFTHPTRPYPAPPAISDVKLGSSGAPNPLADSSPLDKGAGALASARPPENYRAGHSSADVKPLSGPRLIPVGTRVAPPARTGEVKPQADMPGAGAPPDVMESQSLPLGTPKKFRTDPLAPPQSTREIPLYGPKHPNFVPNFIDLMANTSKIFDFPTRIVRVSIADSRIADIQVVSPFEINLIGHQPGFTTLAVWDDRGHYLERQVRVDRDSKQQVLLNVIVAELDRSRIENQGINYSVALKHLGLSLVGLPGAVATPFSPTAVIQPTGVAGLGAVASTPPPGTLPLGGSIINMLLSQNVTYGLAAGNGNVETQSLFNFLEQHQLGKVLAEPHLLANSGEKAQFLSGGEIPIVVAQALNTSIVFKKFGTSVVFVPTVVGNDQIELAVRPEVSEPDYAHGVQLFGFTVPAFVTRRAETMVRLRNKQTLIIAGLLLDHKTEIVEKVPYLGDIPYAGALFRNTSYQDQKTDLVMSVTPQIVTPLPPNGEVYLPTSRGPLTPAEIKTRRVYPYDAARPRF